MEYNEENLNLVLSAINQNLTIDLLPKNMRHRNAFGGNNNSYGHCHTVSGCIYKFFGSKNVHMYRGLDDEGLYHWWVVDKSGKIIDPTHEQYTMLGKVPPYDKAEKQGMLGFDYKKRVMKLYSRATATISSAPDAGQLCKKNH